MEMFITILLVAGAGLILWFTYQNVQRNRHVFTKENTSRSVFTLGILTLIIIGVIAGLVILLRHT